MGHVTPPPVASRRHDWVTQIIDPGAIVPKSLIVLTLLAGFGLLPAAESTPLKILLLTGGCCHDYKTQKDVLKTGLQARLSCTVTQIHAEQSTAKPELAIYGQPDYATGFDVVIHDECAAGQSNAKLVRGAQKQKLKNKETGVESEVDASAVVTWTNLYGDKKTRVFSTTIGHNTETVANPRYLDLVARGVLWATNHLADDGTPAPGYGRQP